MRSSSSSRVERVLQAVAEQVEGQHREQQRRPGKTMYHHAVSKISVASAIIAPQLALGGWTPTPRNDSAASKRMFGGMISVL